MEITSLPQVNGPSQHNEGSRFPNSRPFLITLPSVYQSLHLMTAKLFLDLKHSTQNTATHQQLHDYSRPTPLWLPHVIWSIKRGKARYIFILFVHLHLRHTHSRFSTLPTGVKKAGASPPHLHLRPFQHPILVSPVPECVLSPSFCRSPDLFSLASSIFTWSRPFRIQV